jgi:hypothetical protein
VMGFILLDQRFSFDHCYSIDQSPGCLLCFVMPTNQF